ncbi:P-loop NTPase fold protein [Streptomyces prunicolor]|uniref:KAP family P-loop NTPase fold protein n=1 Tax=Streptomyces prunicolor TaxID=67348 RepID=UPI0037CDD02D
MIDARFFNDEPFVSEHEAPDLLRHQQYAQHAVTLLNRVRVQTESGVLALIGPWGSGKSTILGKVMRQLRAQADDDGSWLVAELNPWLYSDLDALTMALFSEIREALPKDGKWPEVRKKIGGFGQAISPLGKLTSLVGLDSEPLIQELSNRISGDSSVSAAKRSAEEALRGAGRPVLVVMDDLDRLTPDELLLVFKLVRLVGHLPNVYYLIGFDEQTLLDVLRRSELVGDSEPRAREFLEKIIQVRLDLPSFRERDADVFVDHSLAAVLSSHGLTMRPADEQRFVAAYIRCLQGRLRTPRAIKRFFGQVDATLGSVVGNVDLVDFLLVTFLRTNEPGAYRLLSRHRAELTGTSLDPAAHRDEQPGQRAQKWRGRLRDAGVADEHVDGVLGVLASLFAPVSEVTGGNADTRAIECRLGVGSIDYFDRYMVFGVPDDDLPEATFELGLQQLADGVAGAERDELVLRLQNDTHRIVRRIGARRTGSLPVPSAALLTTFALQYGQLSASAEGWGLLTADRRVEFLAADLLTDLPENDRPTILKEMAGTPDGAVLAVRALRQVEAAADRGTEDTQVPVSVWEGEARSLMGQEIAQHLAPAAGRAVEELTEQQLTLIWAWRHADPPSARAWITDRLDDAWAPLDLLATLLSPAQPPFPAIDDRTFESLDALIGMDNLCRRLEPLLDVPPEDPDSPPSQHRARILNELRTRRANASSGSGTD